jgi:hypothetical protein
MVTVLLGTHTATVFRTALAARKTFGAAIGRIIRQRAAGG